MSLFICFFVVVSYFHPWLPISQLTEVLVQLRPINTRVHRTKSEETEKQKVVGRTVLFIFGLKIPAEW